MTPRRGAFLVIQLFGTLLSRFSGFGRFVVQSALLGARTQNDIYIMALWLPNLLRALLAEEAIKSAFLPRYKSLQSTSKRQRVANFVTSFRLWLVALYGLIITASLFALPSLVQVMFQGLSPQEQQQVALLSQLAVGSLLFLGYSGYLMSLFYAEETNRGHWVTALCPIAFNGGVIACGVASFWFPAYTLELLAIGLVVGALAQLLVQVPSYLSIRENLRGKKRAKARLGNPDLKKVRWQWWPAVLASASMQINVSVDRYLASFLEVGAVTALFNAARLFQVPVGAIGVSTAVSLHATLSGNRADTDNEAFNGNLFWGIEKILFLAGPLALLFFIAARPLSAMAFQYGRFDAAGVERVSIALQWYAVGIIAYCVNQLFRVAYSALQDVKARSAIDLVAIAANIALNLALLQWFRKESYPLYPALALGTAIASWLQCLLYAGFLRSNARLGRAFKLPVDFLRETLKVIFAAGIMAGVGGQVLMLAMERLSLESILERVAVLGAVTGIMVGVYLGCCILMRVRQVATLTRRLRL